MSYLSHVLEWVRALLVGPRTIGDRSRARTARTDCGQSAQLFCQAKVEPVLSVMMSAFLALARLHRFGRPSQRDQDETHPLVRVYVLPPEERQRALFTGSFAEAAR